MADTIKNVSIPTIKQIRGNYHVGDIYKTVNNYSFTKKKIQFETITCEVDDFSDYLQPVFINEIFEKAKTERFVLIGG